MATLTGHAVKMRGLRWDHTYVRSSDGHRWRCWGRDAGGRQICSGRGDSAVADCLSQPGSQAGIIYAITGVCHQTANRILNPADVVVSSANGYRQSVFLWGTYGLRSWPQRAKCAKFTGVSGAPEVVTGGRPTGIR